MSILFSILEDELNRNLRTQAAYTLELSQYQKGSLIEKKRNNKIYYYLAFRNELNQIKTNYVGSENSPKVNETKEHIKKRKEIISILKKLVIEEVEIRKMLRHDR
ncbi:MAG: hypothetical protein HGB31_08325 [Erysipelotrichaceae bacterium]|nr:hypothetical protein [Erysipelotrichaceae bacterium]